ncbi:MAG: histidine phosphatase family protein [Alphaproteobacteria bacterium]|nr:histidine phosphatase family protein [Alphaproteobacteria bacterium]MBP7762156.1 histidine phosphatase family protein [Alphaproteobacteria bacterium]MBP7905926.1 histidine phosphatase family protein [Alphaproteobacteria bacterium]
MLPARHFYMIRHGETEANAQRIMAGRLDSPLNETGKAQARAVHDVLSSLSVKPRTIVHSHLSRARDTAKILNEVLSAPIHEDAGLAELDAGDWEGQPYEVCSPLLQGWQDPPNGETFTAFAARLKKAKSRALNTHDGPVLIVSHGGVFRGLGMIYGLEVPGVFKNCQLHEFIPDPKNTVFPWAVWSYTSLASGTVREKTDIFHQALRKSA